MDQLQLKGKTWRVKDHDGFDGLKLGEDMLVEKMGSYDCVVKIEAISLNFRDLMVAQVCI